VGSCHVNAKQFNISFSFMLDAWLALEGASSKKSEGANFVNFGCQPTRHSIAKATLPSASPPPAAVASFLPLFLSRRLSQVNAAPRCAVRTVPIFVPYRTSKTHPSPRMGNSTFGLVRPLQPGIAIVEPLAQMTCGGPQHSTLQARDPMISTRPHGQTWQSKQ
jgi:hypothetical protein